MLMQKQARAFTIFTLSLSPIIGLIYGLRNLDRRGKHLVLTLFGLFYGLLLTYSENADAGAHVRILETYYTLGVSDFFERLIGIIMFNPPEGAPNDLYIHFLFGISGSMFASPSLLFALVGATYGYFYGNALLKVITFSDTTSKRIGALTFMLILLFIIHRSFESMQTIRSWTGMWVLFNGVFSYHQTKKKKYLFLIFLSPFFHLMYGFIAVPAILAIIFKSLPKYVFIGVYIVSFLANVNTLVIVNAASHNDLIKNKLNSYYRLDQRGNSIDPIYQRQEETSAAWYVRYGKTTSVYLGASFFIFFIIIGGFYSRNIMNNLEYGLMTTALLMASLANILSFAYALYSRTMANASIYILAVVALLSIRGVFKEQTCNNYKKALAWTGVLIFLPKIVFFISNFLYSTSMMILAFPFFKLIDTDLNFSIRDFINIFI